MRCASCPLFTSWNNESGSGEECGLFGDGWDNAFQYEDKNGAIVGCYIDRHFIEKTDEANQEYLLQEAASLEAWMLKTEKKAEEETDAACAGCPEAKLCHEEATERCERGWEDER